MSQSLRFVLDSMNEQQLDDFLLALADAFDGSKPYNEADAVHLARRILG